MDEVNVQGIQEARPVVYRHLKPTPLIEHPLLSRYLGTRTLTKHENYHPTGSFKIRGGLNFVSHLSPEEKKRGVITATRGNHGQSIALASSLYDCRCIVAVPEGNNPEKNEAMAAFGAELIIHGKDFDEARQKVEQLQESNGMRYIHSANEPLLIHGVGTYALEILKELPHPDVVFVPVGGGSGICGVLTAVRALSPSTRVVGVQAEQAPAIYETWKQGARVETATADTIADGLATRVPFDLTMDIIHRSVDDLVTVTEDELREAVYQFFRRAHTVAEPAGASPLAAALKLRSQLSGKQVVLILTGSNIDTALFREILEEQS